MEFSYELTSTEYVLIGLFLLLYFFFIIRTLYAARQLKTSFYKVIYKLIIRSSYFTLLIIALLEPHIPNQKGKQEVKAVSKDIFVALDLSLSMKAEDVPPSRLKRIQFELKKISQELAGNRIGLIVFSTDAYLQCPLTYDRNAFNLFLDASSPDILSHSGTDIAKPLKMALHKLQLEENTKNHAKSIILISDGEDFGEEMENIAKEIKNAKIKVFTLGIGSTEGGTIPVKGGVKYDRRGNKVITTLNRAALKKLAKITNGRYFEISDRKNDTQRLTNAVEQLKGTSRDNIQISTPKNIVSHYLIYIALALMVFDLFVSFKILKL